MTFISNKALKSNIFCSLLINFNNYIFKTFLVHCGFANKLKRFKHRLSDINHLTPKR